MKALYNIKIVATITTVTLLGSALYLGNSKSLFHHKVEAEETKLTLVSESSYSPAKTKEAIPPTIDSLVAQGIGSKQSTEVQKDVAEKTEELAEQSAPEVTEPTAIVEEDIGSPEVSPVEEIVEAPIEDVVSQPDATATPPCPVSA